MLLGRAISRPACDGDGAAAWTTGRARYSPSSLPGGEVNICSVQPAWVSMILFPVPIFFLFQKLLPSFTPLTFDEGLSLA